MGGGEGCGGDEFCAMHAGFVTSVRPAVQLIASSLELNQMLDLLKI